MFSQRYKNYCANAMSMLTEQNSIGRQKAGMETQRSCARVHCDSTGLDPFGLSQGSHSCAHLPTQKYSLHVET